MTACAMCGFDPQATVIGAYEFHIDKEAPSLNDRIVNTGVRRHVYARERDEWCMWLRERRLALRIPFQASDIGSRRRVHLVRVFDGRKRERDRDNLIGGMKAIVDALVLEHLLVSDAPSSAELHYSQERGAPAGVRFRIEVLG